jgi:hypothetical protein
MLIAIIPIVVLVLGLILWRPENAKAPGQWMFICGLLVTLLIIGGKYALHLP